MLTTEASQAKSHSLTELVRDNLRRTHFPALRRLWIQPTGETLVVLGDVQSFHQLQIAVAAVRSVAGDAAVDLRITVATPA